MKHTPDHQFQSGKVSTVLLSNSLSDFREWWPRSGARGDARCFAYQCADILEVWCDTIGKARKIEPVFVCVLAPSGRPALLLPLGIQKNHGVSVLRFIDGGVSDYNAPVVFPEAALFGNADKIWTTIKPHLPPFDLAVLEKLPEMVEDLPNPLAGLAAASHPESCHAVRLYGPWEQFARERIAHFADSRRRRRKLEKLGPVQIRVAENAEEREQFLSAMMRLKRRKFIETKGFDAFSNPGARDYYRETNRRLAACGPVHLSALLLGDRILAAHWGYVVGRRFYHLMPAHESGEWRTYAPGRLLNEWLLQWCVEHDFEYLDFGIGDEPYKFDYCDVHTPLKDAYLPETLRGRFFAATLQLKNASKARIRDTRLGATLMAARKRWYAAPQDATAT